MSDWSVRNTNAGPQQMADALLRATGGTTAVLLVPPVVGDSSDGGQLGIAAPGFQALQVGPVTFRRTRPVMREGQQTKYELLVSASAVAEQVSLLEMSSAEALFGVVAGVRVAGLELVVEGWGCSAQLGAAVVYRLLLREAEGLAVVGQG